MFPMNRKAMALIEIVVSMIVLAVAALAVAATINMINSKEMRSAGGSSLDLQAASYARETLEMLKNAVSSEEGGGETGEMLVDGDPDAAGGTVYDSIANPALAFPTGSEFANLKGLPSPARTYTVWDMDEDGDLITDYKKVTVTVTWPDL